MKDDLDISRKTEHLRALMAKHLGVKAKSFEKACKSAGRRVPSHLRKAAARLSEADRMARNPKLQRYMDAQALDVDFNAIQDWLVKKNFEEERKTRRLNFAALVAFQFLLVLAMLIAFLRWRDLI